MYSLSIPYMPPPPPPKDGEEPAPAPDILQMVALPELALPTGEVIQRPFKHFGYQLHIQDPQSTIEIHANVCPPAFESANPVISHTPLSPA
jgi:hypothetical protein